MGRQSSSCELVEAVVLLPVPRRPLPGPGVLLRLAWRAACAPAATSSARLHVVDLGGGASDLVVQDLEIGFLGQSRVLDAFGGGRGDDGGEALVIHPVILQVLLEAVPVVNTEDRRLLSCNCARP